MARHKVPGMPGWVDLGSDMSWDDYGGRWGRLAKDGSVYVVDFTNMYDACGEVECRGDGQVQYVCEVKRVDLPNLSDESITKALECLGLRAEFVPATMEDYATWRVFDDGRGDEIANGREDAARLAYVLAEACVSYGYAEPLDSFSGDKYPARVRADARRAAESLMKDAPALEKRRQRVVNKIGSTAAEYGRGDLDAALNRGPGDVGKNLMRELHGLPPLPANETT